jgi:hypothetical protein
MVGLGVLLNAVNVINAPYLTDVFGAVNDTLTGVYGTGVGVGLTTHFAQYGSGL